MRYERVKHITAFLSAVSVTAVAVSAAVLLDLWNIEFGSIHTFTWITAGAAVPAAMAAYLSIVWSRRLERERENKRIFLLYAREDLDAVRRLAEALKERGFNPWLDVDELVPGAVWQKSVLNALEESAAALVFVSRNLTKAEKSGFVQEELKTAMNVLHEPESNVSPVIPVRLDDTDVPERLSHIRWVDLQDDGSLEQLERGLRRVLGVQEEG